MPETWNAADPYEAYVGRWSRRLAPRFLAWAGLPPGARVLEVGCGTGALSEAILGNAAASLAAFDLSPAYVEEASRRLASPIARFEVADAQALPVADGAFDAAVSGLVLNFVPRPEAMLREMRRALVPGGLSAVYVWDYAGRMEPIRRFWDAAVALDPAAREFDEGARFPICDPSSLARAVAGAGFRNVEVVALDEPTVFRDFEDYWAPFLGGQGPAPSYCVSLSDTRRDALRERLRATLPTAPDGSIPLVARAWATRGRA